jgi:hypothetical protein
LAFVNRRIDPLKPRDRVRKDSRRVEVKRKLLGGKRGALYKRGGRKSILLEGTQPMPARPSDKDRMGVKTLKMVGGESLRQRRQN